MSPRRIHFLLLCSTGILSRSSQTGARGWQSEIVGAKYLFGPWRRPSLILLWTAEHYRICKRLVFGAPKQPRMDHAPGKSGGGVEGGDQLRRGGGARATKYRGAFRCSRTRARDHAPGCGGDSWAPTTQPGGIARVRKSSVPSGTERAPKPTRGCNAPRGLRLLGCERFEGPAQPEVSRGKTALTTPRVTPYPPIPPL